MIASRTILTGSGGVPVGSLVFKTSGAALGVARWVRLPCAPATTVGIPAGGVFAGAEVVKQPYQVALYGGTAGIAFDVCYHLLCDTLTNVNLQGLEEHSDAATHAILTFAQTTSAPNGTGKAAGSSTKAWDWKGNHLVR